MKACVIGKIEPQHPNVKLQVPESTASLGAAVSDYLLSVRALYDHAVQRNEVRQLAWALTRWLAWILFRYRRPTVTADVFGWLGEHLGEFAAREQAEQELDEFAKGGGVMS